MTSDFGRYLILIDLDGGTVSGDDLSITVDLPPGTLGVPYVGAYIGHDGVPPYTYATSSGSLPTGLSLDVSTGAVTGTPTALGSNHGYFEFTASVTDSAVSPVTKSLVTSIRIGSGVVISGTLPPAEVGIAYAGLLGATGGTPPYTWTIPSGALPTGTSIDSSTGFISGTPTVAGTYNFTVRATDSASVPQDFPSTIVVAAAVSISTSTFPGGIVGIAYSAGPTRTGGVAPFTYSISSGAIPAGTNFDPRSGFVTGVPTTAATYTFHVTVVDVLGGTSTYNASVVIAASGGGTSISTGAAWTVGNAGGPSILAVQFDVGKVPANYTVTGWQLEMDKSGTFSVEVQKATSGAFPTYSTMSGVSTSTGGLPIITSAQSASSSDVSLWSSTGIGIGDSIRLIIHANNASIGWFSLMLTASRAL